MYWLGLVKYWFKYRLDFINTKNENQYLTDLTDNITF